MLFVLRVASVLRSTEAYPDIFTRQGVGYSLARQLVHLARLTNFERYLYRVQREPASMKRGRKILEWPSNCVGMLFVLGVASGRRTRQGAGYSLALQRLAPTSSLKQPTLPGSPLSSNS